MPNLGNKLSEKQRRFVEAYMGVAKGNATEAARIAGYKGDNNSLAVTGWQNLIKPKIKAALDIRVESDPLIADKDEIQHYWTKLIRDETGGGLALRASELLAKTHGMFIERHEVKTESTVTIECEEETADRIKSFFEKAE